MDDLGHLGHVEEEHLVGGDAVSHRPVGELGFDGRWAVEPAGVARSLTRFLVRRPADPSRCNGTVLVGRNNLTAGHELLAESSSFDGFRSSAPRPTGRGSPPREAHGVRGVERE